ncbi:MAG: endonuclease III domain-containing protein [Opitutales bacterium]
MIKAERAQYIGKTLDRLYPETPIPLDHTDAFTLLVAVLLSAQTTDKKVNEVTPALFRMAGTPQALARQPPEAILKIIRPLGLAPQKAKHLAALGRLLVERHGGEVPQTLEALEALPGVGHKTASVVLVQAFGVPAFPVDTHIHRLAQCWGLTRGKNVAQTEADLKKLYPPETWYRRHLQIIFYGRERCPARPRALCAICQACYPRRKKPKAVNKA